MPASYRILETPDYEIHVPGPEDRTCKNYRDPEGNKAMQYFTAFATWLGSGAGGQEEDSTARLPSLIFLHPFPPPDPHRSGNLYMVPPYL